MPRGTGFWGLEYGVAFAREFSRQIHGALAFAEERAEQLRAFRSVGHDVYFAVYGFSGAESKLLLSPGDVGRLADLGLPLRVTPNLNRR